MAAAAAATACMGSASRTISSSSFSSPSSSPPLLRAGKCSFLFPIWRSAGNGKCSSCQGRVSSGILTATPRASTFDNNQQQVSMPSVPPTAPETLLRSLSLAVPEGKADRDVSAKAAVGDSVEKGGEGEGDVPTIASLPKQSDIEKKLKKKAELRRKRLKRKRMLRKKGRWPPSKMAKLKNV